jgi:hypothetical protein
MSHTDHKTIERIFRRRNNLLFTFRMIEIEDYGKVGCGREMDEQGRAVQAQGKRRICAGDFLASARTTAVSVSRKLLLVHRPRLLRLFGACGCFPVFD